MAKKESTFVNMTVTLFLVTAVAATALGFVYELTKDPIKQALAQKEQKAINVVVPGADQAEIKRFCVMPIDGPDSLYFYEVVKNGEVIGTAVKSYTYRAFSGYFSVIVGFKEDGSIIDSDVLKHNETPGLGDKTGKSVSSWNAQFKEKNPANYKLIVKKDGGDVDAITAATISSRAYCDAINRAYETFMNYKKNGGSE